ncbi:MAG: hypothetical protein JXO72_07415 [Vicinamibacteria bacterium]|nr:hypothetical protein [Vicinamibacteria bacterium]
MRMETGSWKTTLVLLFLVASTDVVAGEIDVAVRGGVTLPFYEQRFPVGVSLPYTEGLAIRQQGDLAVDARGGILFGVGLRFWANGVVGVEGRYESGGIEFDVQEPIFLVAVGPPLPVTIGEFPVTSLTSVDADRLAPVSLNLALRSGRRTRVVLSGGVSYLPALSLVVRQRFTLGLALLDYSMPAIEAGGEIEGRIGANAGLSLELPLGNTAALLVEGRGFVFQSEKFDWDEAQFFGVDPLGRIVVDEMRESLRPVEFTPTFCHFAVGVIYRF